MSKGIERWASRVIEGDLARWTLTELLRDLAGAIEEHDKNLRSAHACGRRGDDESAREYAHVGNRYREAADSIRSELRRRHWRP